MPTVALLVVIFEVTSFLSHVTNRFLSSLSSGVSFPYAISFLFLIFVDICMYWNADLLQTFFMKRLMYSSGPPIVMVTVVTNFNEP
jgi:hypothetical protein